jgi:bifunctional non-homologous end joining protein LigD
MLSRPGTLPSAPGWSFELKWDGFRAIVSTEDGLRVRSRRGWNMMPVLPELRKLPAGLVLDGELVAWRGREPYFPLVCRRVLNNDLSVPITYVVFDLLQIDNTDVSERPYSARRDLLEDLDLRGPWWATCDVFDDGAALYTAVCAHGLEGVVAKKRSERYRPGERGWVKLKNPSYWRRDDERDYLFVKAETATMGRSPCSIRA